MDERLLKNAYQQLQNLAIEQNAIVTVHVNSATSKDHHGQQGDEDKEKRLLTMEDVAEAWGLR